MQFTEYPDPRRPWGTDGANRSDGVDINRISATAEGFEKMFDREHLETFLALRGVKLLQAPVDIHSRHVCQNSESLERCLKKFLGKWRRRTLLHLECPFLKQLWDVGFIKQHRDLFEEVLLNHKTSTEVNQVSSSLSQQFSNISSTKCMRAVRISAALSKRSFGFFANDVISQSLNRVGIDPASTCSKMDGGGV